MLRQTFRGQINLDVNKPEKSIPDFVQATCYKLPFASESFDSVFFFHVIEHLENPFRALCEISRVLRADGKLFLATPNSLHLYKTLRTIFRGCYIPFDGREAGPMNAHIQTWGVPELRNLLCLVGFHDCQFRFVNHGAHKFLDPLANKFGLSRTLEVTCRK